MNIKPSICNAPASATVVSSSATEVGSLRQLYKFGLFALGLSLCFGKVLWDLARYSLKEEISSHVLIVPLIVAYLVWVKRKDLPPAEGRWSWQAALAALGGAVALGSYWGLSFLGVALNRGDALSLLTLSFVTLLVAGALYFFGPTLMKKAAFPAAFMIFLVPLPSFVVLGLEIFFQRTSAEAANVLFALSGTPYVRDGQLFTFTNIPILVAEECSGIRSSLVLFMTSLLAGHLFLHDRWRKIALVLFVVPLGILRNGFRIFTIAMLCVHMGPQMIDSAIHRRGGPVFFVLSLIPFFLLLAYLRKTETAPDRAGQPPAEPSNVRQT